MTAPRVDLAIITRALMESLFCAHVAVKDDSYAWRGVSEEYRRGRVGGVEQVIVNIAEALEEAGAIENGRDFCNAIYGEIANSDWEGA